MAKKKYKSPILMLSDGGDDVISFGGSQGTGGDLEIYTWDPILDNRIGGYDDTDLAAMDINPKDYYISVDEFDAFED